MKRIVSFILLLLLISAVARPVFASDTDIIINEFQLEPSGSAQWVELYNKGSDTIDLTGWVIDDSGGSDNFSISSVTLISHQCLSFQSSLFHLNTATNDSVRLLHNGATIDSYTYDKSPGVNISFGRAPDGENTWITFSAPTRDSLNADGASCASPTPTPSPTMPETPTSTKVPTPTKTPTPIKTPTPTKIPTPTKDPTPIKTSSSTTTSTNTTKANGVGKITSRPTPTPDYHVPTAVLGVRTVARKPSIPSPSRPDQQVKTQGIAGINLPFILIVVGAALFGPGGVLLYLRYKNKNEIAP